MIVRTVIALERVLHVCFFVWVVVGLCVHGSSPKLSSKYPQTAYRPMTIFWRYFHTIFCLPLDETASKYWVSRSCNKQFFEIPYFQEFVFSRPRIFFQKSTKNDPKKFAKFRTSAQEVARTRWSDNVDRVPKIRKTTTYLNQFKYSNEVSFPRLD